jgi:hypothetical protein
VEAKQACHQYASRELNWFYDDDGMLVLRGRLTPEDGAIFLKVMDAMFAATDAADLGSDHGIEGSRDDEFASLSEKTFPQKRADMFALMAEQVLSGLDQGLRALAPADKYQVVINIEGRHQCNGEHQLHGSLESDDTTLPLPASVLRRICCDASLVAVVEDGDGNVLNVGRKTRAIPPAIRRALKKRDHGCRFPGCCETKFVDAHHIVHWSEGGETKLDNLILLCRHHHRLLHQEAYEIVQDTSASELTSDSASATTSRSASAREAAASSRPSAGGFVFMSPSGQRMPHSLSPQFVSAEDAEVTETLTIEREHAVLGLQIDESTAVTHLQGERLDFDFAVDVMLSSARQAPPPGPYQAL